MTSQERQFIDAARSLVGTKWRHRGRSPRGVDCIGLVAVAGQASGLAAEDEGRGYGREPWEDRLRIGCRDRWGDPLPRDQWRPGCIAIFRWGVGKPSHMGILGDHPSGTGLTLIHASNMLGVVECSLAGRYADAVVEVYEPRFA